MLKRKITQQLIDWKTSSEKAMLVTGARQIGKSYAIREFAKQEYQTYVEINLYDNKAATKALLTASSMDDFLSRLSLFAQTDMIPGNTLIFIDEVQEAPDIMTMVKFLVQDGRFDYIFSGSMLGTEFKGVRSYPVGYVTKRTMRPMDFEEFCWAIGIREATLGKAVTIVAKAKKPVHNRFFVVFQIFSRMATAKSRWLASKALSSGGVLFVVER